MPIRKNKSKEEEIINKGGQVAKDKNEREWVNVHFRMPKDMLDKIDEIIYHRPGMYRSSYILELISKDLKDLSF